MARKLRVYGWTGWNTAYNHNGHNQVRAIVAAHSLKEVAEMVGVKGPHSLFNLSQTWNEQEIEVAMAKPGTIFWCGLGEAHLKKNDTWLAAWTERAPEETWS